MLFGRRVIDWTLCPLHARRPHPSLAPGLYLRTPSTVAALWAGPDTYSPADPTTTAMLYYPRFADPLGAASVSAGWSLGAQAYVYCRTLRHV